MISHGIYESGEGARVVLEEQGGGGGVCEGGRLV